MYANQNIQKKRADLIEHFDIRQGRYFWLFLALVAVFVIYMIVDCFNLFGGGDEVDDCGCDDNAIVVSTSGI